MNEPAGLLLIAPLIPQLLLMTALLLPLAMLVAGCWWDSRVAMFRRLDR